MSGGEGHPATPGKVRWEVMALEFLICRVTPQPLAVVRARATSRNLGDRIREILAENLVYPLLKKRGVAPLGLNVIVYRDEGEKGLLNTEEGLVIEVGVGVPGPFADEGRVVGSSTPGGTAVTAVHLGPYSRLGKTHAALRAWCRSSGRPIAGPNWEVYGHWNDDPAQLRTEVFYLLHPAASGCGR